MVNPNPCLEQPALIDATSATSELSFELEKFESSSELKIETFNIRTLFNIPSLNRI